MNDKQHTSIGSEKIFTPETLIDVQNLKTCFFSRNGTMKAVDGVSFSIQRGEVLGVAGESGCGKSVTAQSILRIIPKNGKINRRQEPDH